MLSLVISPTRSGYILRPAEIDTSKFLNPAASINSLKHSKFGFHDGVLLAGCELPYLNPISAILSILVLISCDSTTTISLVTEATLFSAKNGSGT